MNAPCVLMASGHSITLRAPDPALLKPIGAVAHSLAQINRFCGHAHRPYSVAEHSLLVSDLLMDTYGPLAALAGLMHDAHEALIGDCTSPVKAEMRRLASARSFEASHLPHGRAYSDFDRVEACAQAAIRATFGLITISHLFEQEVHAADMVALATERRDLMPEHPEAWECLHGVSPSPRTFTDLMDRSRCSFSWTDWRDAFIERYQELDFSRREAEAQGGQSLKAQLSPAFARRA